MPNKKDIFPPPPPPPAGTAPPKPKGNRDRQVSFTPLPAMSAGPTTYPRHASTGHVTHHRPAQVTWSCGSGTGKGFVRVTGGSTTTNWHNYDASIPVSDLLTANKHQQDAILDAVDLARCGRSHRRRSSYTSDRIADVTGEEGKHPTLAMATRERIPLPPRRPPSPTSVSKAVTRISHHSSSSHGSKKSNRSNRTALVLTCVSCGQEKNLALIMSSLSKPWRTCHCAGNVWLSIWGVLAERHGFLVLGQ